MNLNRNIVWFRDDLRIADHPALSAALASGPSLAVYILDEQSPGIRPLGAAARWWLHHALIELRVQLAGIGVQLLLYRGRATEILPELVAASGAETVHWNRRYGGAERALDAQLKERLAESGKTAHSHAGLLLQEPWIPLTQEGNPFRVFTPFYNAMQRLPLRPALPVPPAQHLANGVFPALEDEDLAEWKFLPTSPDWSGGLAATWEPGERPAHERLDHVLEEIAEDYVAGRDRPDRDGTSRLSPALRWGHLSPVQVWEALGRLLVQHPEASEGARAMMRQLVWRDFCWNLLYHQPRMSEQNLRPEFDAFDWAWPSDQALDLASRGGEGSVAVPSPERGPDDHAQTEIDANYAAWCRGATGFGLVDAGMKQLWDTGWMHNRVRMVTASLLVKNLGIHWRTGEQWFWDTLVDADAASNPANWQWVAGCGADASPYFRIFNPLLQAKKFDPRGAYVTRFAPIGQETPVVDLKESRAAALDAYARMKSR